MWELLRSEEQEKIDSLSGRIEQAITDEEETGEHDPPVQIMVCRLSSLSQKSEKKWRLQWLRVWQPHIEGR